jgi:hypothetical protein
MRSPVDLVELPYSFTQLTPLTSSNFIREAHARGVHLTEVQLEGLHRLRLLVPLLRVRRDGRAVASAARRGSPDAWQVAHWQPTQRWDLVRAKGEGRLHAAADGPFVARRRLARSVAGIDYRSSDYLYSAHQLLLLPVVRQVLPLLSYRREADGLRVVGIETGKAWTSVLRDHAKAYDATVVMLSALEPIYYPLIVQELQFVTDSDFAEYEGWRQELSIDFMLEWLGVGAEQFKERAIGLLREADGFDPLGEWLAVVREAAPDRWKRLKGTARNAIDFRIAAEIFLRHCEDLAAEGRAEPIELPSGRWSGGDPIQRRLKPQGGLDGTLTDFGLSPHPSLLLVVEGDTELLVFPRLMQMFGIRTDENFISIHNAQGVTKNLSGLVSYAIGPRIDGTDEDGRYLRLLRPLARVLVVMDPEGPMSTRESREKRRAEWVERILQTFPQEYRSATVRDSIERLVYVETWDPKGQSFEFAHFTDRQLASATAAIDKRSRQPMRECRIELVTDARKRRGSLKDLGAESKTDLAERLWPMLAQKIRLAERRGTVDRVPIVRVLHRATHLARELPRRNLVIPTGPDP